MRTLSLKVLLLAATPALVLLGGGCSVEAPTVVTGGNKNNPGSVDMASPPDLTPPDDGQVDPPTLDAITKSTTFTTVPVHGLAKPSGSVLIEGTATGTISADVATDGRFCVDVNLDVNKANTLTLRSIGPNGTQSDPIQVTIMQTGTQPVQQGTQQQPANVALGGSASEYGFLGGSDGIEAVNDGDPTTEFGGHYELESNIITLQLASRSTINKVKITAPGDCPFTAAYTIWSSNDDAPSNEAIAPMSWQQLTPTSADSSTITVALSTPILSTHIEIVWHTPFVASGNELNCGSWAAYYAVAEMEAWTVAGLPPVPPTAPSCAGGGN